MERKNLFNCAASDYAKKKIPTPQKFVQFYTSNARGEKSLNNSYSGNDKPTTEKMETNLVSPSSRSHEQVIQTLKRKLAIKRRTVGNRKQKPVSKQPKQKSKQKKKTTKKIKSKRKDIFDL